VQKQIKKTILLPSTSSTVWKLLTAPEQMKQWMGEPEMEIEIRSDWEVNGSISISGFHHERFENKGTIFQFEPNKTFKYTHLSSLSKLPDVPENYCIVEFTLTPIENETTLTLTITNFSTEIIFKHLDFYWRTTLEIMRKLLVPSL
jgi:uncharacterized protein YndB with AHSA1/START domain